MSRRNGGGGRRTRRMVMLGAMVGLGFHTAALAEEARIRLDIPAQPLSSALDALRAQSNIQLLYSADLVGGRSVPALKGEFSA